MLRSRLGVLSLLPFAEVGQADEFRLADARPVRQGVMQGLARRDDRPHEMQRQDQEKKRRRAPVAADAMTPPTG